jgi:GR25 family glycosyltransferase involved in LPS biosynthesis
MTTPSSAGSPAATGICLAMIVRNEAHVIAHTLQLLVDHVPGITHWVISDTGSDDGTPDIVRDFWAQHAKKLRKKKTNTSDPASRKKKSNDRGTSTGPAVTGHVRHDAWQDFGTNRSIVMAAARDTGAAATLMWDADDIMGGVLEWPSLPLAASHYMVRFGNPATHDLVYWRPQLFNNAYPWRYEGVLHEYATCDGANHGEEPPLIGGNYVCTSGRTGARSQDPLKYAKDAAVFEAALVSNPTNARYVFYCGNSYRDAGNPAAAAEKYKALLAMGHAAWVQERYMACMYLADIATGAGREAEATGWWVHAVALIPSRPEAVARLVQQACVAGHHEVAVRFAAWGDGYTAATDAAGRHLFGTPASRTLALPYYTSISAINTNQKAVARAAFRTLFAAKYAHGTADFQVRAVFANLRLAGFAANGSSESPDGNLEAVPTPQNVADIVAYRDAAAAAGHSLERLGDEAVAGVIAAARAADAVLRPAGWLHPAAKTLQLDPSSPVLVTITACKRWPLLRETLHSMLDNWTDLGTARAVMVVDDHSPDGDCAAVQAEFPFVTLVRRPGERGHRASMNWIHATLAADPSIQYWVQLEDDWRFVRRDAYITRGRAALEALGPLEALAATGPLGPSHGVAQVAFNRHYAETYAEGWALVGSAAPLPPGVCDGVVLHSQDPVPSGPNCAYWPHFTFRPSILRAADVVALGPFDAPQVFFERGYADKWTATGLRTAFFNTVSCVHTGKLTNQNNATVANAYTLNGVEQFGSAPPAAASDSELPPAADSVLPPLTAETAADATADTAADTTADTTAAVDSVLPPLTAETTADTAADDSDSPLSTAETTAYIAANTATLAPVTATEPLATKDHLPVPEVFVINLVRRPDRKAAVTSRLTAAGFATFRIVDAVDGGSPDYELDAAAAKLFAGNPNPAPALACAQSHLQLWRAMRPGTTAIILEDDCMLYEGVTASAVVGAAPAPSTATIRMFGYHSWAVHGPAPAAISADTITPWSTLATDYAGSTVGYAIPYAAAAALLTYFDARGITKGIDTAIRDACADAASGVTMDALVLCWSPWCRNGATDDSDIQFAPFVPVVPDFVFHAHCDSMDGDIQCVGSKPVLELAAVARVTPGCTAFNTLGYLKRAVALPLVRPSCFAASASAGIWIKKQNPLPNTTDPQSVLKTVDPWFLDWCRACAGTASIGALRTLTTNATEENAEPESRCNEAAVTAWLEPGAADRVRAALHGWDNVDAVDAVQKALSHAATAHAAFAARVQCLFPGLAAKRGARCIEIGGGLGATVVALAALFPSWTFTVVELPEVSRRCAQAVAACGIADRVQCVSTEEWLLRPAQTWDLVISNHAWSECSAPVRKAYADMLISHCDHGLLTCRFPQLWDDMRACIEDVTEDTLDVGQTLQRSDVTQLFWCKRTPPADVPRPRKHVWAYLQGGTGNQLYIAAHAVAYAARHGIPFDRVHLSTAVHGSFEVSRLLAGRVTTEHPPGTATIIREQGFAYDQARWQWPLGAEVVVLHGYFQQHLCCAPALPTFRAFIAAAFEPLVLKARPDSVPPRIAMHIRRGDYTTLANVYCQLGPAYYTQALVQCPADAALAVFSDDIAWCRSQPWIAALRPAVEFVDLPPAEALSAMARCEYHVVANSTFSCWGAILASCPKAVVVPAEFYQNGSGLTSAGIPWPGWSEVCVPCAFDVGADGHRLLGFVFFPNCDSPGHDLKCLDRQPAADLALQTRSRTSCAAFNTLGFVKHHVVWPLRKPPCLSGAGTDGLWVKDTCLPGAATAVPRVRLLCSWGGPEEVTWACDRFVPSNAPYRLVVTGDPAEYDLCVIFNSTSDAFDAQRSWLIQLEPWNHDITKPWGVRTWGPWAIPALPFLGVIGRQTPNVPNLALWQLPQTADELHNVVGVLKPRGGVVACVTSSKRADAGHVLRLEFLRYLESDGRVDTAIYGSCNECKFRTYAGPALPCVDKDKALLPYKYYFMAENCAEPGFITEKLWDPLLAECLCFYWGAPDANQYLPPDSFVALPLDGPDGFKAAADLMTRAIAEDWHTARLPAIRAAREVVLSTYSLDAVIRRALRTLRLRAAAPASVSENAAMPVASAAALAGASTTLAVTAPHKAHWFDEFTILNRVVDLVQLAAMPADERAAITCVVAMEHPEVVLEALALLPNATRAVVWNTEQMTRPHARYSFTTGWSRVLSQVPPGVTVCVWDYSAFNARVLEGMIGEPVAVVPTASDQDVQALRQLRLDTPTQYDYVCVGTASPHRNEVLGALSAAGHTMLQVSDVRAADRDRLIASAGALLNVHYDSDYGVYESVRCSRWLRAGMRVVTEPCVDDDAWRAAVGAEVFTQMQSRCR